MRMFLVLLLMISTTGFAAGKAKYNSIYCEGEVCYENAVDKTAATKKQVAFYKRCYVVVEAKGKFESCVTSDKPFEKPAPTPAPKVEVQSAVQPASKVNRFRVIAGMGTKTDLKNKYEVTEAGNEYITEQRKGFVYGVGYDRVIHKDISAGISVLSNETGLINIGLDF